MKNLKATFGSGLFQKTVELENIVLSWEDVVGDKCKMSLSDMFTLLSNDVKEMKLKQNQMDEGIKTVFEGVKGLKTRLGMS